MGAIVPGFFSFNPCCCAELPPVGDGPQYDFLADGHGKIFNIRTGKFVAFVASGIAFVCCALPDVALPAMHEQVMGQAAAASDIFRRKLITVGESAFAGGSPLVKGDQLFFQFLVVVPMSQMDGAHAAVKPAGGNEIRFNGCHVLAPFQY
jgi:hypothetical protein